MKKVVLKNQSLFSFEPIPNLNRITHGGGGSLGPQATLRLLETP